MSMRPQSHDIIRTWAFYTILRSEQIKNEIPWKDIMIHGFIMAPDGTPMHTSIGNVIDPIPILEQYGADALRYYAATCSLGIDHAFREKDVIRGRKLCNKVYNIGQFMARFVDSKPKECKNLRPSDRWIISRYSKVVKSVTEYLDAYTFDKAMRDVEDFIWHEFADHYVEMVKSRSDDAVKYTLYNVFLGAVKLLAPFMPHVTEEVYQSRFRQFECEKSIHITDWPKPIFVDDGAENVGNMLKDVIASVRGWKAEKKIALNAEIQLIELIGNDAAMLTEAKDDISETVKAKRLEFVREADLKEEYTAVKPVHSKLGPKFKADAKAIVAELSKMDPKEVASALEKGPVSVKAGGSEYELTSEFIELEKRLMLGGKAVDTIQVGGILVVIEM